MGSANDVPVSPTSDDAAVIDVLWIPLGAGQRVVRTSGWIYEALMATAQRRPRCALYHSALAPSAPTKVWGRDEFGVGDRWNSNSVTSWLLVSADLDTTVLGPPSGGRGPGWDAGVIRARACGTRGRRPSTTVS